MSHVIPYCDDGISNPATSGIYVAWVNDDIITIAAARKLLFWDRARNRWGHPGSDQNYRGHVYAWCGPLPVVRLEDEDVQDPG